MDFVTLYGTELDRELGTTDRTQRFTVARRKAAINAGQLEWVKRTECLVKETTVSLVDDTQEYDLESTITDWLQLAKNGVSIRIVSGSNTRYIEGDDLTETTMARLSIEEPGWRAVSASTPTHRWIRRDGGALKLGLHPKPSIDTETWTAIVQYVLQPSDMSVDADVPFTVSSNALTSLVPWHRALVYYAAFDLEKLRKDTGRQQAMLQLFEAEVEKFKGIEKPKRGQRVRLARDYRRRGPLASWQLDPRRSA